MNIKLTFVIILCFIFSFVEAQNTSLESIKETDLKAHLEFISSDLMQGRDFGTPIAGLDIAAEYLKSQCLRIGLKPINEGDYIQMVDLTEIKTDSAKTYIRLQSDDKKIVVSSDSIADYFGSTKDDIFSGGVVYVGYAWINEQTAFDDFKGVDLKDKYVLAITRNREMVINNEQIDVTKELLKHSLIFEKGAKGIIKVIDPLNPNKQLFEIIKRIKENGKIVIEGNHSNEKTGQIVFVTESVANEIIKESGKTLKELQEDINETGSPNSFEITKRDMEIHVTKSRVPIFGKNIIGIIEGSDTRLKNEYIILTAHYDHLGVSADGQVYNGADDNGSGTSALIEIAEAFSMSKEKPKRSIIFAWTTAEEHGLFGSKYYTENPIVPLEKTIACINLDMVGRSRDSKKGEEEQGILANENEIFITSGKLSSDLIKLTNDICNENGLYPRGDRSSSTFKRSDHYPFFEKGIPIVGITTGIHDDYHKISDISDKIDYAKMKKVTQFAFLLTNSLANRDERITIDKPNSN